MHHLYVLKVSETPSLWTPQTTSNPRKALELNIHDFIEKLPMSNGSDTILVIIDCLTKQSIFIPIVDTITSPMLAKLFILHIFSKHGVPSHVTSNCSTEFVSTFFCSLGKVLDMKLHFTLGYHPEGNGQTEGANQTLKQYLRVYCNYVVDLDELHQQLRSHISNAQK